MIKGNSCNLSVALLETDIKRVCMSTGQTFLFILQMLNLHFVLLSFLREVFMINWH